MKNSKKILFWGGTEELDPDGETHEDGTAKRVSYVQYRPSGKRDAEGNMIFTRCTKEANPGVEVCALKNRALDQLLRHKRAGGSTCKTARQEATEMLKSHRMREAYSDLEAGFARLANAAMTSTPLDEE